MNQKISFFVFLTAMLLMTTAGCYYLGRRLIWTLPFLQTKKIYVYVTLFLFVLLQTLGPLWYRLTPTAQDRPFILQWLTYVSLGFVASLFFYFLAAELLVWISKGVPWLYASEEQLDNLERRLFLGVGFFSLASAAMGTLTAVQGPQIKPVEVPLTKLPKDFDGFTIAQISDLHVGPTINREYAQKVVDLTMAQRPDLIVLTGDMIDGHPEELRSQLEPLKNLSAPHGVLYVTGNHEYYWGGERWCAEFQQMGFEVLINSHRLLQKGSARLSVGGIPDLKAASFVSSHQPDPIQTFQGVSEKTVKILLAHQPASYPLAQQAGVDLQLSGHTHGGQFFPWNLIVAAAQKFYRGLYSHEGLWVYTNSGTGYWGPPQRFAVPSEITLIRLKQGGLHGTTASR